MGFQQTPRTSRPARVARRGQAGQGVWGLYFHGLTSVLPSCRDARPGASVGASSAHANGQRRSRQFRVEGLGFRVEGLGFGVFLTMTDFLHQEASSFSEACRLYRFRV